MPEPTLADRLGDGWELVASTIDPMVAHLPRHPAQREGTVVSLCNQTVVLVRPDAPARRGREPLPQCPDCTRARRT